MKKITLVSLSFFILIVATIYILGFPNNRQEIFKTPILAGVINSPNINILEIKTLQSDSIKNTSKGLTLMEVANHNTENDCYLIINNNVYNISSYIISHPGGPTTIISHCGKKVTGIFAAIHSNRAWDLLKKYKINTITNDISRNKLSKSPKVLTMISKALKKANPSAEIVNVKPKADYYIAKIIYKDSFYEVHINNNGQIFKEEKEGDELNWSLWNKDENGE